MDVLIALIAVVGAFYFILLRPVMQQQRKRRAQMSGLTIGDEVLTTGGFYGTVVDIQTADEGPMIIRLEVAPGIVLRATPAAIDAVSQPAEAATEATTESAPERGR
ncbi:MAG: preprotein translocase subunit YajC [Dehalococcoidia bacterium]